MKTREVVRFEIGYQLRRPMTWVYFAVLFAITFQITAETYSFSARANGYFFNAPFVFAVMSTFASGIGLLATAAFAGEAGARDVHTGMFPLVYTSSVGRGTYLLGRFVAAFALNVLILAPVPLAVLLPAVGVDKELMGPYQIGLYAEAFFLLALPNAFVTTALLFAVAVLSRRSIASYLAGVLLFFMSIFMWTLVGAQWGQWEIATLLDPGGIAVISEISRSTTGAQKNVLSIASSSSVLLNRAVWLSVACVVLALTYARFRFVHAATAGPRWRRRRAGDTAVSGPAKPIAIPKARRRFGFATHAQQTIVIGAQSFREVATSWGGFVLAGLTTILIIAGPSVMNHLNVPLRPTTQQMAAFVGNTGEFLWLIVPILTVYYVGELVWRERETRLSEIADATPVPEWVRFLGKFLGVLLVFVAYQTMLIAASMLIQTQLGYYDFELGLYGRIFFGLQLADHVIFALLAFAVHVIVNHKYVGHMVALIAFGFAGIAGASGIEHKLLLWNTAPDWSYSDLRGFGPDIAPWLWFKLYWAGWALLLAVAAKVFWIRAKEHGVAWRLRLARERLTRSTIGFAVAAAALVMITGGFTFYNTNVLNTYDTSSDRNARRVEYERKYGRFRDVPQPTLVGATLRVEIHPDRRQATIDGTYSLVNKTGNAIDSVVLSPEMETSAAELDRPATRVVDDTTLGHRVYALSTPLAPGDSLHMRFDVRFQPIGFTNGGVVPSVVSNGSYFLLHEWLPAIGYQPQRELSGAGARRAAGLPVRAAYRSLDDSTARLSFPGANRISLETIVGTTEGQTAVAPGALRRTWSENGRRYFHYVTDSPIRNDVAIYSAAYAVRDAQWNDVSIQIVHDPRHAWNVDAMVRGVQASLEYFSKHYGPYPYRQLRLVEHAGRGVSLHASPINVSYQEGFSLLNSDADPRRIDFPFAVVAHEIAHQWWGNQVSPARVEGAALLSESLAWYSALCAVQATYGDDHLARLHGLLRSAYLAPRPEADVPLLRARDQYSAYRKGPFAMYALREYVGVDSVNAALRRFVAAHGAARPPFPTSRDLYRELQAVTADSLQYLLVDLFEKNTFWRLSTKQVAAEETEEGNWRVSLDVQARKVVVDTIGNVTDLPMNDLVEIGVYGPEKNGERGETLYLRQHRVRSGDQRIVVTAPKRPGQAGIDPRHLLIDNRPDDNVRDITFR